MSTKITTPLSRKAVLVSVNISQWTARKLDRAVTDEVNASHGAANDAGRYNKLLLEKEALAELTSMVSAARALHYKMTQPWADDGPRILPNALFGSFSDKFRTMKREFNVAADKFARLYPSFIEARKASLNGLFNADDYPAASEIRSKFNLDLTILPFPDAADFRSELDDDTVAEIKASLEKSTANVLDGAMKHTVSKIVETVGHMATKLAGFKPSAGKGDKAEGVFRDTLVENVRELAALLPAFNLTNDPQLAAITERIQRELCAEDADYLRENDQVRAAVKQSADEIVEAVSGLFA
jgi:hypothetical protein